MADENEDQWLYGDSVDGKDESNLPSETQEQETSVSEKVPVRDEPKDEDQHASVPEVFCIF